MQPLGVADLDRVDREAVLLAAIDCVVRIGDHGLLATHVAAEAGTEIERVRGYFPTASALAEAVVDRITDEILGTLNEALSPDDRLRLHLRSLARMGRERPALFLVLAELELRGCRDGLVRAALARSTRAWRDRLDALVREGVTRGVFSASLDVEAVVDLITAAAAGTGPRSDPSSRRLAQLERLLLPGTPGACTGS